MKENYEEEYIRSVKETLRQDYETLLGMIKGTARDHKHLTDSNKTDVERALYHVVSAYHLALSSNSLITMRAVDSAFAGALFVGVYCAVSSSAAKYWEIRKRGGPKKPGKRSKGTKAWKNYIISNLPAVRQLHPDLGPKGLAVEFTVDERAPKSMPEDADYIAKFIRPELKALKAGKKTDLRLVG